MSRGPDARTLVGMVLDEGSFRSWDESPVQHPQTEAYAAELASGKSVV